MEFLIILIKYPVILTMRYNGTLLKMETKLANPIEYELPIGDELVYMNHLIGKYIAFKSVSYTHLTLPTTPYV